MTAYLHLMISFLLTVEQTLERTVDAIDHVPMWPQRFFNVISAVVTWTLLLFLQYWKANAKTFNFHDWWAQDRTRFIAGSVVTVALVILKATSKDIDILLEFLGFKVTNTSGIAYGLAIAAFLLGLKTANGKTEASK